MSITLEDLKTIKHPHLTTLQSKAVYLMIARGANEEGWSPITAKQFAEETGLTIRGVYTVVYRLIDLGLIEKLEDKDKHNEPNRYRIVS